MNKSVSVTELWRYPEKLIPSDWSVKQLKKVTKKIADRDHTTPKYVSSDIGVPIVSPTNLDSQMRLNLSKLKYITKEAHEKNRKKTDLLPEDIIFSRIGAGLGKSYLLDNSFYNFSILHSFCQIRVDDNVIPQYLLWFLRCDYLQWRLKFGIQSIGVPDLGLGEIGELPILFPNQKIEQKKIAQILSSVDEVIEKTQAQIDKLKDLKTGMMQELLTKGIGHVEFKDSPVGRIPVGWDVKLLDTVAKRGSGHTPNKLKPDYWNGHVKWVSLSDSNKLDRLYIHDTTKKISQLGIENSSATPHPAGTVVMARDAGIGKSAITTSEMAVSQHFMAWICGDKLDNYFLYYLLQHWKPQFENIAMGSTIKTIGLPYFKKLNVPVPPIDEQLKISQALRSVDEKIFSLEKKNTTNKNIKKALMQDLLTGKVRVNAEQSNSALTVG